jgi:hypothetical protein
VRVGTIPYWFCKDTRYRSFKEKEKRRVLNRWEYSCTGIGFEAYFQHHFVLVPIVGLETLVAQRQTPFMGPHADPWLAVEAGMCVVCCATSIKA